MGALGVALLGIMAGAAGVEMLRAQNPELLKRIEDAAKRFVERLGLSQSSRQGPKQE